MDDQPESMLPLSQAVFHILLALSDGEKHGYGIMLEIEERTDCQVKIGPGTLYGAIKRLLGQGLIEEAGDYSDPALDDERRTTTGLANSGCASPRRRQGGWKTWFDKRSRSGCCRNTSPG